MSKHPHAPRIPRPFLPLIVTLLITVSVMVLEVVVGLLDVVMPGLGGLATLKKLLEIDPKLGVVMATGQQDDQTVKQAIELGASGYVLKPFDLLYLELVVLSRLMIAATAAT